MKAQVRVSGEDLRVKTSEGSSISFPSCIVEGINYTLDCETCRDRRKEEAVPWGFVLVCLQERRGT